MNIYLQLPKYLAEWCVHEYGTPDGAVAFPRGGAENDVLEMMLDKLPEGALPDLPQPGDTAIRVPCFKSKPAPAWCNLSEPAKKVLRHVVMVRLRVQLWHDLYCIEKLALPITDTIYDWMERHGIEADPKSWEAIRQMYMRQRKSYSKGKPQKKALI